MILLKQQIMIGYQVNGSELDDPLVIEQLKKAIAAGKVFGAGDLAEEKKKVKFPQFLGEFKIEDKEKYKNLDNKDGAKNDKGHLGNSNFKNLFPPDKKVLTFDLSPNFGTEIEGIQLSDLDDAGRNDLALFLERRGMVVFRDQDFRDKSANFAKSFGEHFGPLHIHPVSFSAEDHPEILVTYRPEGGGERFDSEFANKSSSIAWHSDISFEKYPASFSFFVALEVPESGGDTIYADTREAYRRLSPPIQKFLESLTAIHSNHYQNKRTELGGHIAKIKETYFTEHPLIRTHPVTGEKSLFYSRAFIQGIKGLKSSESNSILSFLEEHINNPEFQIRATHIGGSKRNSKTVIAWDNRVVLHSATLDFLRKETSRRHHYRITVIGERPYLEDEKREQASLNGHTKENQSDQ